MRPGESSAAISARQKTADRDSARFLDSGHSGGGGHTRAPPPRLHLHADPTHSARGPAQNGPSFPGAAGRAVRVRQCVGELASRIGCRTSVTHRLSSGRSPATHADERRGAGAARQQVGARRGCEGRGAAIRTPTARARAISSSARRATPAWRRRRATVRRRTARTGARRATRGRRPSWRRGRTEPPPRSPPKEQPAVAARVSSTVRAC